MRTTTLVSLALAGVASTFATIPALAAPGENTTGLICQVAAVEDPSAEPGTRSGELSGGPLVVVDDANAPETGTLTCTVQVDQPTHGGADGPSVSSAGTGVFTAGPAQVTYTAGDESNVYLCSSFTDASEGQTYYFNNADGTWSTDPNTPCQLTLGSDEPTDEEKFIDSAVCPVLAIPFRPEGDIVLPVIGVVKDCPPYRR